MAKKVKEQKAEEFDQIDQILEGKLYKNQHFGAIAGDEIKNPKTFSTKSLMFDYQLSQNLPGERGMRLGNIVRISGPYASGKTSVGLTLAASFQETIRNAFVFVINAESRITLRQIQLCGVNTDKSVFRLFNCNRGDTIFNLIENLLIDNPDNRSYFFLLDSSDAINRTADLSGDKTYEDHAKIAGSAALYTMACKRLALPISVTESFLFITSQERANMNASPMGMNAGPRKITSGGEALNYFSSWVGSVKKPWSQKYILEDPSNLKSKVIGHNVEIDFLKNFDGHKGFVTYPIKYNHGIYHEREILMMCQAWGLVKVEGRTYSFTDSFKEDVKKRGFELAEKIVGQRELNNYFDSNPEFINIATNIFEEMLFGENRTGNLTLDKVDETEEIG